MNEENLANHRSEWLSRVFRLIRLFTLLWELVKLYDEMLATQGPWIGDCALEPPSNTISRMHDTESPDV
jgi:hypothetical protein